MTMEIGHLGEGCINYSLGALIPYVQNRRRFARPSPLNAVQTAQPVRRPESQPMQEAKVRATTPSNTSRRYPPHRRGIRDRDPTPEQVITARRVGRHEIPQ